MNLRRFVSKLERQRLASAIGQAEARTSGQIVVFIHHRPVADAVASGRAEFVRRKLNRTNHRNAVLLFVAPASHSFAIIGDEGVHKKCGDAFWSELASAMQEHFRSGDYTSALLTGIERAGDLLAEHFPREAGDKNEIPDNIIEK